MINSFFLCLTAASVGLVHTLLGPDHYLPFIALSKADRWTLRKTLGITLLCGIGHILGSVLIGGVGIAMGATIERLVQFEDARAIFAGWLLLGFGAAYFVWGIRQAVRNRSHTHWHAHEDGTVHTHAHTHHHPHVHVHADAPGSLTPWALFIIFVFGPCEPLIPLLMIAASRGTALVLTVIAAFSVATFAAMAGAVWIGCRYSFSVRIPWLPRYGHALAGLMVLACAVAVQVGL